jgi:hypothetical protein
MALITLETAQGMPGQSEMAELALQKATSSLAGEFDALTFLFELKKTRAMVASVLPRVAESFWRTVRSGRPRRGDTANWWLEGQYGWLPLLLDAQTIYKNLTRTKPRLHRLSRSHTISNGSTLQDVIELTPAQGPSYGLSAYMSHTIVKSTEVNTSARGWAAADVLEDWVRVNPLATAWELIPLWSIIVDWFLAVSEVLIAVGLIARADAVVGSRSVQTQWSIGVTSEGHAPFQTNCSGTQSTTVGSTTVLTKRIPGGMSFVPQQQDWSIANLRNALAFLQAALKGKKLRYPVG